MNRRLFSEVILTPSFVLDLCLMLLLVVAASRIIVYTFYSIYGFPNSLASPELRIRLKEIMEYRL